MKNIKTCRKTNGGTGGTDRISLWNMIVTYFEMPSTLIEKLIFFLKYLVFSNRNSELLGILYLLVPKKTTVLHLSK